jgi:hypothetical protein
LTSSQRFIDYSSHFNTTGFKAAFSLKQDSEINEKDRIFLATTLHLDSAKLVIPKQTHSNHVKFCKKGGLPKDTDGLVSEKESCVLSIQVADCIPVYFLESDTGQFGLMHAGWRGVENGIIQKAVSFFNPKKLRCLLGPSIQHCCFEIGPDVGKLFSKSFQKKGKGDRSFLNLQNVVMHHLTELGMDEKHIMNDKTCTKCNPENFHSYRRDGYKAGRHIAVAGWLC